MTLISKLKKYFVQIGTSEFDLFGLIQIIKNLIIVNNYPDVSITVYDEPFGRKRIRGELVTCTGEMIVAEFNADSEIFNTQKHLKEYVKTKILREIGYKFIERAYESRQKKKVTESATRFLYSCKEIYHANIQFEMS